MKLMHLLTKRNIVIVALALVLVVIYLSYSAKEVIVCAGDSLTYGSGVLKTRDTDSYPAQLFAMLGDDYDVINCGLRNATASETGDLPYIASDEYKKSLKYKASVVILMLGTNDTKTYNWDAAEYEKGLSELVESYQALKSNPKVILMRSPYVFATDGSEIAAYDIQPAVVSEELEAVVKAVSEKYGTGYIDLYELTQGKDELYTDGVHFTKEGYTLISDRIYSYLKDNGGL